MSELSPYREFIEKADVPAATRQQVKSSSIASVGYDADTKTLEVEFTSGSVYKYSNVSAEEHQALINAPSIGKHFGQNIRGRKFNKGE